MDQRLLLRHERRRLYDQVLAFFAAHVSTARALGSRFGRTRIQVHSVLLSLKAEGVIEPIGVVSEAGGPGELLWGLTRHGQHHGVQDACARSPTCKHCRRTFAEW